MAMNAMTPMGGALMSGISIQNSIELVIELFINRYAFGRPF